MLSDRNFRSIIPITLFLPMLAFTVWAQHAAIGISRQNLSL